MRNLFYFINIFWSRFLTARKYKIKYKYILCNAPEWRRISRNKKASLRHKKNNGTSFNNKKGKIRQKLFYINGNICFWCMKEIKSTDATIDHIVPVSIKKNNNISNLRLIHDECRVSRDMAINKGVLTI